MRLASTSGIDEGEREPPPALSIKCHTWMMTMSPPALPVDHRVRIVWPSLPPVAGPASQVWNCPIVFFLSSWKKGAFNCLANPVISVITTGCITFTGLFKAPCCANSRPVFFFFLRLPLPSISQLLPLPTHAASFLSYFQPCARANKTSVSAGG